MLTSNFIIWQTVVGSTWGSEPFNRFGWHYPWKGGGEKSTEVTEREFALNSEDFAKVSR